MSKKTIYVLFEDKDYLFARTIDYCFDKIKEEERKILERNDLSLDEKLKKLLAALPDGYSEFNFHRMDKAKEKYPTAFKELKHRLEIGWEETYKLINEGIENKIFKEVNLPLFKQIFESAVESFFRTSLLDDEKIAYDEALNKLVEIMVNGIMI